MEVFYLCDFVCKRCGNCCRPVGYVRLKEGEAKNIADYLNMTEEAFFEKYTKLTDDRKGLTLIDNEGRGCIFLDENGLCAIQPVKPAQCRDFPYKWNYEGFEKICRGMKELKSRNGR